MPEKLTKDARGFTFFEIMTVVTILALIMAIALPNYIRARNTAREKICISNQKMIYTAAVMFMNKETVSLEDMGHKERLEALIEYGYLRGNKWCECPSSSDDSFDDYTLAFESDFVSDVECDVKPADHVWP